MGNLIDCFNLTDEAVEIREDMIKVLEPIIKESYIKHKCGSDYQQIAKAAIDHILIDLMYG